MSNLDYLTRHHLSIHFSSVFFFGHLRFLLICRLPLSWWHHVTPPIHLFIHPVLPPHTVLPQLSQPALLQLAPQTNRGVEPSRYGGPPRRPSSASEFLHFTLLSFCSPSSGISLHLCSLSPSPPVLLLPSFKPPFAPPQWRRRWGFLSGWGAAGAADAAAAAGRQ